MKSLTLELAGAFDGSHEQNSFQSDAASVTAQDEIISHPPAVVVGLCAHGLGIARELDRAGVHVIALEADKQLPGVKTRHADIRFVSDINGPGLIRALQDLAATLSDSVRPVLFLTNDRMVDMVGRHIETISPRYRLSWAHSANELLPLLGKENIDRRCRETGLKYPRSQLITAIPDTAASIKLEYPIIAKPTRPLSAFKTLVVDSFEALVAARAQIEQSQPVLLQEYIPGRDNRIHFGALYLDAGRVIARFEGRKLLSRLMGLTVTATTEINDEVHALAARFFAGLGLSGPVSLELKTGPDGKFWVIEPTVGRTDFWEGLCSANGISMSQIEYLSSTGQPVLITSQRASHLWINGERFPTALVWLLFHAPRRLLSHRVRGVYFDLDDPGPYLAMLGRVLRNLPLRVFRKIGVLLTRE